MYKNHQELNSKEEAVSEQPTTTETVQRNNSKIYFFIIAITALLATNVYFYVKFKSSGEKLYTMAIQKQDLQTEIDRIEAELDNLAEIDVTETDSALAVMRSSEQRARQAIQQLRANLENKKITEVDILTTGQEVSRLKREVSDLKLALEELIAKNEMLEKVNASLTEQVTSTDQKVNNLSEENNDLKDKVTVASALKVSNMQVNGISLSKRGRIATETRARRTDQLQILFSVVDNALSNKGPKEVFVRIINPAGDLIGDASNLFYVHGEKLQYTFKENIHFTNNGEEYQFLWPLDKFDKGAYTILLYHDNAVMGRGSVVLR